MSSLWGRTPAHALRTANNDEQCAEPMQNVRGADARGVWPNGLTGKGSYSSALAANMLPLQMRGNRMHQFQHPGKVVPAGCARGWQMPLGSLAAAPEPAGMRRSLRPAGLRP